VGGGVPEWRRLSPEEAAGRGVRPVRIGSLARRRVAARQADGPGGAEALERDLGREVMRLDRLLPQLHIEGRPEVHLPARLQPERETVPAG